LLPNQILHKTIQDIKRISGLECAIWDGSGSRLAATSERMSALDALAKDFLSEDTPQEEKEAYCLYRIQEEQETAYCLALVGVSPHRSAIGEMGVSELVNLMEASREKMDRNRFIQNLLSGNLLQLDIYNQAREMRIPDRQRRVVYVIEPKQEGAELLLETLKGLFSTGTKDFVTAVSEKEVIVVMALEDTEGMERVEQIAQVMVDTLRAEAYTNVRVAFGTVAGDLAELGKSYQEAKMALEVGRIFYVDRDVLAYQVLGIGRLIHQLDVSLCEMFLQEVFKGKALDIFDEEELTTVYTFFNYNLNISETARQLYVHRNTLMNRLEKVQKKTGLDIRVFDDAVTFKIAIMVAEHVHAAEQEG